MNPLTAWIGEVFGPRWRSWAFAALVVCLYAGYPVWLFAPAAFHWALPRFALIWAVAQFLLVLLVLFAMELARRLRRRQRVQGAFASAYASALLLVLVAVLARVWRTVPAQSAL
jgi:hypothetical protein